MSDNDKTTFDNWDDFEDFSMFDEGLGEGSYKSTTKKGKAREAVGLLTGGFVTGVKKSLFTRNFYQNLVSKSLPKEYSTALDKGLEVKDSIEDLYDTAHQESRQINDKLTKGVKPLVDKYGDKIPKRMSRPLRRWTRNVRSSDEWTTANKDELESVAALNDIFNKREQTRSMKNSSIEAQVQTGIAKNSMSLTAQMLSNQSQMVAYQDQIDATWKRKTLELQYKQFFVQRKLLDIQQQSLSYTKLALDKITHNTSLPDLVKAKGTEVGSRLVTEKLYGAAIDQFSGLPYGIIRNLTNNVTKKMRSGSRSLQQDLSNGLEQLFDMAETSSEVSDMMGPRESTRAAGETAGGMFSSLLTGYVGKKIKKKYGDNEKVMQGADMLSSGMRRVPRLFNGMIENGDTGNLLIDMLVELTDAKELMTANTGTIMKNQEGELSTQVYFDLLTKKSITEIIPGYLTRIHHEIRTLRTGESRQPMLAYDFNKGVFSNDAAITTKLKDRTIGSRQRQALAGVHDELSDSLGLNELSAELRYAMLKQFSLASINNTDFTFGTMLSEESNHIDETQKDELREFLLRKYNLTIEEEDQNASFIEKVKTGLVNQQGVTSASAKAQRRIMDSMDKLQSYLVNPTGTMNKMAQRGQITNAVDVGIVDEKNGRYVLNKERFIEALMSGSIDITDTSGDFEPEVKKDTATRKYFDDKKEKIKEKLKAASESETAENAKAKVNDAKARATDIATNTRDNVTARIEDLREEIDDKGIKRTVTERVTSASDKVIILEFLDGFNKGRFNRLKEKYSKDDRFKDALDIVKKKYGTKKPTMSNIKETYASHREFRLIIKELQQLENEIDVDHRNDNVKDDESDISPEDVVDMTETPKFSDRFKFKKKRQTNTSIPSANDDDYNDAEDYADNFIDQNGIDDPDGNIKQSLIKDFFSKRFGDGRVYKAFIKSGKYAGGAISRGKQSINDVRAKGTNGAVGEAMGILFELSKWSAKAVEVGTRPSRAVLKLLPWGLKKITNLVIDTVNFKHIEHGLWLEGEKEPRLLKTGLLNGRYINENGDIVEKPKDLVGNIFDAMSTPEKLIMSASEYKGGLYDSTGKLIYKPPSLTSKLATGLVKLPFKLAKGAAKLAGKFTMGYLKITTKPVSWLINKIMTEKRIDPKLHAELAQLGLTDQTNSKLDDIARLIDERFPDKDEPKYNDSNGDGRRDGNADDVRSNRSQRRAEEKDKKQGLLSRILNRKKKKDTDDEEDEDGFSLMNILGKGKLFGRLAGLAKNPYVLGGAAIASMIGWEGLTDSGKNKDPEDVANMMLPDGMKDNKMARIGARISEKLVNLLLAPIKGQAKGIVKTVEYASRFSKWINRKDEKLRDSTKTLLSKIPGATAKFLFGRQAGKALDKLMNIDNINPLFRFRMAQYGFKHTDAEGIKAILKLEDDILKDLVVATDTAPARISDAVTIEQSASYFGVSINDEEDLTEWVAWFANRFRPVFLSNVTVMQRMNYDSRQLHNADSLMGKKDKTEFIKKVDFNRGNFNPYDKPSSPMGTEWTLDVIGQSALDKIKEDSLAQIDDMPDDVVKLKEQRVRTASRENKLTTRAKARHKDTVAEKRFDPYAAIDRVNFKSIFGLKKQDKSINEVIKNGEDTKPGFGGGGAGASFEQTTRQANIDKHGAIGEMLSGISGLFMNKAHAAPFFPEAAGKKNSPVSPNGLPTTGTFKVNGSDGVSSLSPADKPMAVARNLRSIARSTGTGNAAKHVKQALIASGYKFTAPASAADYPAKALPDMGFAKVKNDTPWLIGDIMVFSSNRTHKHGHIQIFDGANWISDYVQESWIPMSEDVPTFTLWRDVNFSTKGKYATKKDKQVKSLKLTDDVSSVIKPTESNKTKPEKDSSSLVQKALDKIESLTNATKDTFSGIMDNIKASTIGQGVGGFVSAASDKVSNTLARMTGSQKEWQMNVYRAFKNAGFSEQQARILTAEIGRENSYNPKYLFAGHADPHKGSNLGMLSWQGSRKPTLIQHLRSAGVLTGSNNMVPGQAALDAQARFIMWELKNTHKSVGALFLSKPNIPYPEGAYLIGKRYILWRIDDPKYGPAGKKNRDGFYNMLLKQLAGGGSVASAVNASLTSALAPVVNPLNKMANKVTGVFGASPSPTSGGATGDGAVAAGTDVSGGKAVKIPGNAKPAVAARFCRSNAQSSSKGQCAKYVRMGLQKAGYVFQPQASAYQYHTNGTMLTMGFVQISGGAVRQVGDVIILNRNISAGKPHGHIAIWDGANWVSDFVQRSWSPYSAKIYPWVIWRDKNHLNGASTASGWTAGNVAPNSTASSVVLSGGSSTYGGGTTPTPYNPVSMKYNDYGEIDSKIKKAYDGGDTSKSDKKSTTTDKTTSAPSAVADANVRKTETTAKSVAAAVESKPSKSNVPRSETSSKSTQVENTQATKVKEQVTKNLTQQMKETESRVNAEHLSQSNKTLRESLKVQKDMLTKLTSMEKHLLNVLKGQATRNVTESSTTNKDAETKSNSRPNRQQEHRVERPGRNEPMSMSKMI